MNNKNKNLFLRQSYKDAWTDYEKSLIKRHVIKWDYVILTASNEEQAQAYRLQLKARIDNHFLPNATHYAVLPDPEGKRVGSGGATLHVLKYIRAHSGDKNCFREKRILVIHSGGDSKRVPQYSVCGKLFSPVPRQLPDGRQSTLFDEFIIGMSGVPSRIKNGMLVLSGDVLLLFNALQIDFQMGNAAAISMKENVATGKNHGVFLNDGSGNVGKFLHKMSAEALQEAGAVNAHDNVDLDTGAILFDQNVLESLFALISTDGANDDKKFDVFVNEEARLSFYGDFLYPLATTATLDAYLQEKPEGTFCEALLSCRKQIWDALHKYSMQLICLSPAEFIHFGTTRELLHLLSEKIEDYQFLDWSKQTVSFCEKEGIYACANSFIDSTAVVHADAYIENSSIVGCSAVGTGCIISNLCLCDAQVPQRMVLHGVQLKNKKYVVRVYGVDDNPKDILKNESLLLGRPLSLLLEQTSLTPAQLWNGNVQDLWNANLYPVCGTMDEAVKWALWLCDPYSDPSAKNIDMAAQYCALERMSLCSSFNHADAQKMVHWATQLENDIKIKRFINCLNQKKNIAEAVQVFGKNGITQTQKQTLLAIAQTAQFDIKIRIYYYLSKLTGLDESEELEEQCFRSIRDDIWAQTRQNLSPTQTSQWGKDRVEVRLPVRVNWGGGWSDTPPYCNEHGGTVLNTAVKLNGCNPIVVKTKRLEACHIVLASEDSGACHTFTDLEELKHCNDPFDPFALHKAALIACGIVRPEETRSVAELTKAMGGGLYLSTSVIDIPRGSGLGTSSILAGGCVKSLFEMLGKTLTEDQLYTNVVCMEQLMSTGGGWQDQVGGLTDGIKLITTAPGITQNICVTHVSIAEETRAELQDRMALIYTGQRRLARNILRDVVGKYIASNPQSVAALHEIQRLAVLMKFELEKGDVDAFAQLLDQHWECSKQLDAGCTNTCIDQIFMSCQDMLAAKMVCGAGGGGFLQVILKKEYTKEDLRKRIYSVFQDSGVAVWDSALV